MLATVSLSILQGFKRLLGKENFMKLTDMFLAELERETAGTRNALARVPEGHNDWKPHAKSMPLGYLASLVATMPAWIEGMVTLDRFDMRGPEAETFKAAEWRTRAELMAMFEASLARAQAALSSTTDDHLLTPWQFVVAGHVMSENPRHIMIRDSVLSHLAHHRGQLTVYLRLNGASVPAIYGPSADEGRF
jgi:uncharacterized damage-inducible protein DinB